MTSADVKFSIDQTLNTGSQGWGYLDAAIKDIKTPNPETVVIDTKYPWAPFLADIALFANGIVPNNYGGETAKQFYTHPIGTGPFMWGHWTHGSEIAAQAQPALLAEGQAVSRLRSPSGRSTDTNTRQLQLQGGQAADRPVPRLADGEHAQEHAGDQHDPVPVDAHRLHDDERALSRRSPTCTCAARSAWRSTATRSSSRCCSATARRPTRSCRRRCRSTTRTRRACSTTWPRPSRRWRSRSSRRASPCRCWSGPAWPTRSRSRQIYQQELQKIGIKVVLKPVDPSIEFQDEQQFKYQLGLQLLDDGHRRPGRARDLRRRPDRGRQVVLHRLQQPGRDQVDARRPSSTFSVSRPPEALQPDPGAGRAGRVHGLHVLLAVPLRDDSSKVHGFLVYPTGNFHMEDVWLSH